MISQQRQIAFPGRPPPFFYDICFFQIKRHYANSCMHKTSNDLCEYFPSSSKTGVSFFFQWWSYLTAKMSDTLSIVSQSPSDDVSSFFILRWTRCVSPVTGRTLRNSCFIASHEKITESPMFKSLKNSSTIEDDLRWMTQVEITVDLFTLMNYTQLFAIVAGPLCVSPLSIAEFRRYSSRVHT